ncbi:MAG: branched-chain amino acid ABC transporter permease [Anaerolineaceae bacterium]|jgi:branched-chain amino acid transport system permease protein|nr:branched-chain amino acid ABC transporter permease [Anaerolineaceae bacterium]
MIWQQLVNGISVGSIYALMATGYALIYSLLGFSNWAHGDIGMIGAYIGFFSLATFNLPVWLALIVAVAGAGLVSVISERLAYRRIRNNNSPTMFLMIAAMGVSITLQNFVLVTVGSKFKTYPQILPVKAISVGGIYIGMLDLISFSVSLLVILFLYFLIERTKFGLAVKAAASDMQVASLLGINVDKYIGLVFLLAGSLAGVSGVLLGMKYTVYPQLGNFALKAFIASVFGGLGSVPGAIVGALFIGIMEVFVAGYVSAGLRDLFTFTLLIAVLVIRPTGLFGKDIQDKA